MKETSFITGRLQSFKYAWNGICFLLKNERNAWIHIAAFIFVIFLGIWLQISMAEWCLVFIVSALVMASEAFNSSVEKLVDHVSPGFNKTAGTIKDLAAGGVLLTAIAAIITGLLIFIPKVIALFQ